jgi:dienelactone hydrolase
MRLIAIVCLALSFWPGWAACAPAPGQNRVVIRGKPQDVYYFPAASGKPRVGAVLFLPGDGGWRGFAVEMGKGIAAAGFDVYAWDTKVYLSSFTSPQGTLRETDVAEDAAAVARWATDGTQEKLTVSGWSEGAALAVLAATGPNATHVWRGLLTIGLPDHGFLGWRFADNITYLTKKDPDEPRFEAAPHLATLALPAAMVFSTSDEYVSASQAKALFAAAAGPKRLFSVEAQSHRFDGGHGDLFRSLREALEWIRNQP